MKQRCLRYVFIAILIGLVSSGNGGAFKKKSRNIIQTCTDVTISNDLEISSECARKLQLPWNPEKRWTSRVFMARLQRVERKVNKKIKLSPYERIFWTIVRTKLRVITARTLTRKEFRSAAGNDALCLIVRAHRESFGFCTYMRLLGKRRYHQWKSIPRKENKKRRRRRIKRLKRLRRLMRLKRLAKLRRKKRKKKKTALNAISARWNSQRSRRWGVKPPTVIHLNFFTIPCCGSTRSALCSQYCCDPERYDDGFCNSGLDCY